MAGITEFETARHQLRQTAVIFLRKRRLGENEVNLSQNGGGCLQVQVTRAQAIGHFAQDATNLGQLAVLHLHQLVVELNGFKWFEVQRSSRRTRPMHDALYAALLLGADRNHQTLIADRHQSILQDAGASEAVEQPLNGYLDLVPEPLNRPAHAAELGAG